MYLRERERRMAAMSQKRSLRCCGAQYRNTVSSVASQPLVNLQSLPEELFHQICCNLPPITLLKLSQTCKKHHHQLSFEHANWVWYKCLPPSLLKEEEKAPWPTFRRRVGAFGGMYEPEFNYRNAALVRVKKETTCDMCVNKASCCNPLQTRWQKILCNACFSALRIDLATLNNQCLNLPRRIYRTVFMLPKEICGGKTYLYRPSVDVLMRQVYEHGLSGFQLDQEIRKCNGMKFEMLVNDNEIAKASLRGRIAAAAEQIWTYIAFVCINENYSVEAKMEAFSSLCKQVNMPKDELNHMLQYRFRQTRTLESSIIATLHTRFAQQIKPFLFPNFLLDPKASWPFVMPEEIWLWDVTESLENKDPAGLHQSAVVSIAAQMVLELVDVNHSSFGNRQGGGSVTAWREACKQYHREEINKGFTNKTWMNLGFDASHDLTQSGEFMCRGLSKLRRQLGLSALPMTTDDVLFEQDGEYLMSDDNAVFEVCKEITQYTSQEEKDRIAHEIMARVEKKERAAEKYFEKILLEACDRCPVTSCKITPPGLENVLEHVAKHHPRTFWFGDINILG